MRACRGIGLVLLARAISRARLRLSAFLDDVIDREKAGPDEEIGSA